MTEHAMAKKMEPVTSSTRTAKNAATLTRTTFETSRLIEFFSEKELQMQIGHPKFAWPIALAKELIDNALDACDSANIAPEIEVTLENDSIAVQDNGPGLPEKTLKRSLDYLIRVSDKSFYVSPTRGQLGNALKCVYAAPFVASGEHGLVEVMTRGIAYRIDVKLNHILQQPELKLTEESGFVKNGTLVKIHWPGVAGYLTERRDTDFYNSYPSITDIVSGFACFNPHLTIHLCGIEKLDIERSGADWQKSKPEDPTSAHWYNADRLQALIGAYIKTDTEGGRIRTVREFVSEFRGLSATAKQKAVTERAGFSGAYLTDLLDKDQIKVERVTSLLLSMQKESRLVKPLALGVIGEDHLKSHMVRYGAQPESIKYKRAADIVRGVPYVWEFGFGIHKDDTESANVIVGLNWTPTLKNPIRELIELLGENRVDAQDPVVLVVHLACPVMPFMDRGKSVLSLIEEDDDTDGAGETSDA